MLRRKVQTEIAEYLDNGSEKILILDGARQATGFLKVPVIKKTFTSGSAPLPATDWVRNQTHWCFWMRYKPIPTCLPF